MCSAKYKLKYIVLENYYDEYKETKYSYDKVKDAEDKAISLSMNYPNKMYKVSKRYVLEEGNDITCKIVQEKKSYKTKPKAALKPNQRLIEKHKYMFYGLAAC